MDTVQIPQGDLLNLNYVRLDDALDMRWPGNPKRHDIPALAQSIKQHGFRDPSIYDGTLGAIPAGNGRLEALAYLRDTGEETPVGVGLDETGVWCVPMIFGADAASQAAAEAFGVDHNNLTIAGAGFTAVETARLWTTADTLRCSNASRKKTLRSSQLMMMILKRFFI
ncbi:MAG TPA: hypothetical protein PKD09_09280 [Aggregatilinea sp.]|uniref:hypothetical protein n=1 Tax=Aggregatilinea sp. TaxID=2806333 RepID=UPI002C0E105F|nr:hypothetical protein [Aggregatilinea sp.]HML21828.1 hypothetical protein [Aggregatilinea sp.]